MFRNENQLRKLWEKVTQATNYRIEPSIGSTIGIPDMLQLGAGGRLVFAELKVGKRKDRVLKFKVRPAQKARIPEMMDEGAHGVVVVGEIGSRVVHVFSPKLLPLHRVLGGVVDLDEVDLFLKREGSECYLYTQGTVESAPVLWFIYGNAAHAAMNDVGFRSMLEN